MKIIVMSDSHGIYSSLRKVINLHRDADLFVFLGDGQPQVVVCSVPQARCKGQKTFFEQRSPQLGAGGVAHPAEHGGVGEAFAERGGERNGISGREEAAGDAILDDRRPAGDVGHEDRDAERHRLERRTFERLLACEKGIQYQRAESCPSLRRSRRGARKRAAHPDTYLRKADTQPARSRKCQER